MRLARELPDGIPARTGACMIWLWLRHLSFRDYLDQPYDPGAGLPLAIPDIGGDAAARAIAIITDTRRIENGRAASSRCYVMTKQVTTLKRNDILTLASDIMQLGRIRHLPVLEDDGVRLAGILSQRDLFRGALARALGYGEHAQRKMLDSLIVKEVMTTDLITTSGL
jgi:hypothetical protein